MTLFKQFGTQFLEINLVTLQQDLPSLEMKNDFGPDSGLFLRSTEDGKAWQAMIDYHKDGNLMGIYGEGLGGAATCVKLQLQRQGHRN